ncbi:hypothetical protein TNCV_1908901 [Trichonephila clavipes]|nr:hypothetical protein TNCV_1908901 [Trichonephila clavipes]
MAKGRSKKRRFNGNWFINHSTINENGETSEPNTTEAKNNRKGFSADKKLYAFLGLPFLSKLAFRNQERKLLKVTERVAQEKINAALGEIKGSNTSLNVEYLLMSNEYYGDGDSKGYEAVKNFCGTNSVTKLECIGHVQKRVGGWLRQLKKTMKGLGWGK